MKFEHTFQTNGSGFWSSHARPVKVLRLDIHKFRSSDAGELRIYFDTTVWDVSKHGLVYTDKQFIAELSAKLSSMGINVDSLTYSEQGMQGDDYVSCDIDANFIRDFQKACRSA